MKKYNIIEEDFFDAPLDQNASLGNVDAGAAGGGAPAAPTGDMGMGGDIGMGGGNLGMDNMGGDLGMGFGGQDMMGNQMQGGSLQMTITTYSDIGKIWVVKNLNKIISNLLDLNLILIDVSNRFVKYYEDLLKVQEILSIVLFNYNKYKDRFDVILAMVKLFLVEYFKNMLEEIEDKVKDEKLKKTVKLLILKLESKFYKKVKKETKELKEKEKQQNDANMMNNMQPQEANDSETKEQKDKNKETKNKEELPNF